MDMRSRFDTLRTALDPKSIAVIGASDNPNKVGGRPLRFLTRFGYGGKLYPVNPGRTETQGLRTWSSLQQLPQAPELAIIAVAGQAAFDAVDECAAMGVRIAVVMSGGLTESDPVHGKELERAMVARAAAHGMRIIGPNSQGIANFGTGAIASFSTMFVEIEPCDGPVGIVSQSGAMSVVPYGILRRRGIGVRHSHATGNDCDVTACEMAAVVAEDPALKVLLLYLEGMPDPHHLAMAAASARERGLPIIAIKGGRTPAGQSAAQSHTGALASEDRVVDAFFADHGILRVRDVRELVDGVELYLKSPPPRGSRLVSISTSGATCVLAADAADSSGMQLAKLSSQTTESLRAQLPSIAVAANPVDLTGAMLTDSSLFGRTLDALAPAPEIDAFFIGIPVTGAGYDVERYACDAAACMARTGKPLVFSAVQPDVAAVFRGQGVPTFEMETDAVQALGRYIRHHEIMAAVRAKAASGLAPAILQPDGAAQGDQAMLDEASSLALLANAGVPVVQHRRCASEDQCVAALRELGGPVAVKGCSAEVAHKTEMGIVKLGIAGESDLRAAVRGIARAFSAAGIHEHGYIVARMVRGRHEMMIGAHRDPTFGLVVLVGAGGKYVEAMPDARVLLPPFSRDDVHACLRKLRMAPLLAGVRGEKALDAEAFVDAAMAVQQVMAAQSPRIASIDINPLLIGEKGEGCTAVDAVVFQLE
jgi:acyl-CoA synthetase (NDP forming)